VRAKKKRLKRFSENQTVPHQAEKKFSSFFPFFSSNSIRPQTLPLCSTRTEEKSHQYHAFVVVSVSIIIVLIRGMYYLLKILLLQAGNETNRIQLSRRQKFSTSSSR